MNWTEFLAETNTQLTALRHAIPGAAAGFAQLAQAAGAPGALDARTKELIKEDQAVEIEAQVVEVEIPVNRQALSQNSS